MTTPGRLHFQQELRALEEQALGEMLEGFHKLVQFLHATLSQPLVQKESASQPTYKVFAAQLNSGHTRPTVPAYTASWQTLAGTHRVSAASGPVGHRSDCPR